MCHLLVVLGHFARLKVSVRIANCSADHCAEEKDGFSMSIYELGQMGGRKV